MGWESAIREDAGPSCMRVLKLPARPFSLRRNAAGRLSYKEHAMSSRSGHSRPIFARPSQLTQLVTRLADSAAEGILSGQSRSIGEFWIDLERCDYRREARQAALYLELRGKLRRKRGRPSMVRIEEVGHANG